MSSVSYMLTRHLSYTTSHVSHILMYKRVMSRIQLNKRDRSFGSWDCLEIVFSPSDDHMNESPHTRRARAWVMSRIHSCTNKSCRVMSRIYSCLLCINESCHVTHILHAWVVSCVRRVAYTNESCLAYSSCQMHFHTYMSRDVYHVQTMYNRVMSRIQRIAYTNKSCLAYSSCDMHCHTYMSRDVYHVQTMYKRVMSRIHRIAYTNESCLAYSWAQGQGASAVEFVCFQRWPYERGL